MAMVTYTLSETAQPTAAQIAEIEEASQKPVVYDEDCPPLTPDQLSALSEAARRVREDSKRTISINVSDKVILYFKQLAEETGVGYQSLMNMYLVQCAKEKKRPVFA